MFEWVLTSLLTTPNPKCTEIIDNYQMQYVTKADRKNLFEHVIAYLAFRSPVFGDIGLKRALVMGKFMSRIRYPPTQTQYCKSRRAPEPRPRGYAIVVLLLRTLDNHAFGVAGTGSGYGVLRLLQLEAQHVQGCHGKHPLVHQPFAEIEPQAL